MQIIKIRAKFAKEIGDALAAELSKGIPEEKREVFREMVETWGKIDDRADEAKAIPLKLVEKFNSLCYKLFPEEQDGAEFEKEEVQKKGNAISYLSRKKVYEAAIDKYGIKPQLMMVIEEMSELTKALCKYFRGQEDLEAIADETADVTIMLEQLRLIFNLNDAVCRHMDQKVQRLADRLTKE